MKILIIGGGLQGLSFASSLYNKHQISVVSDDIQTKYCRFYKKVYDTSYSNGAKLIELLNLEHYNVLIPISDISVSVISQQKTEIESRTKYKVAVPDYEKVYKVESKSRFMEFCKNNGVPHPKTLQLPLTSHSFSFPALIKPDYSVGARGITRINSIVELDEKFSAVEKRFGSCTIQEFIENTDYYYNVMLYRNPIGEFLGHTITKIVRMYPVNAGSSSFCITVENDELLDICKDCLNKLDWEGMADFDVLQRLDNGEYKKIEINARVPASLKAAEISGVNFPEIIVCDTMGLPVPSYSYKPGKIMRYLGIDIMWQLRSPRRFSTKPSWFKFFGKNIYYQDIYKADPSTWWTWFAEGLRKMRSRINNLKR